MQNVFGTQTYIFSRSFLDTTSFQYPYICYSFTYHQSFVRYIRYMARSIYLHRRSSVPTLTRTNTAIEIDLIPPPLSTRNSRPQLAPLCESTIADSSMQGLPSIIVKRTRKVVSPPVQAVSDPDSEEEEKALYRCTLCQGYLPLDSKPYTLPATLVNTLSQPSSLQRPSDSSNSTASRISNGSGRVFCRECYIWIYDLGICWTCGEIVGRSEERVGFGWCWWHWGCYGCLLCRVSTLKTRIYVLREHLDDKICSREPQADHT